MLNILCRFICDCYGNSKLQVFFVIYVPLVSALTLFNEYQCSRFEINKHLMTFLACLFMCLLFSILPMVMHMHIKLMNTGTLGNWLILVLSATMRLHCTTLAILSQPTSTSRLPVDQ